MKALSRHTAAVMLGLLALSWSAPIEAKNLKKELKEHCGDWDRKEKRFRVEFTGSGTQKTEYCDAASAGLMARKKNNMLVAVWSAAFAMCGSAYYAAVSSGYAAVATVPIAVASCGGLTETALLIQNSATKKLADRLEALIGAEAANEKALQAKARMKNETDSVTNEHVKGLDFVPVVQLLRQGKKIVLNHRGAKANKQMAKDNLQLLKSLKDETPNPTLTSDPGTAQMGGMGGGSGSGGTGAGWGTGDGSGGGNDAPDTNESADVCGKTSGPNQPRIMCALSLDSDLPSAMGTPEYAKEFEKKMGIPLEEFLSKENSPQGTMAATLGNLLGADAASEALAALGADVDSNVSGSAYAAGAGAAKSGGGGDSFGGLAGLFGAQQGGQPMILGELEVGGRKPASFNASAEDRTVSIFDRVTWRYSSVGKKWVESTPNSIPFR